MVVFESVAVGADGACLAVLGGWAVDFAGFDFSDSAEAAWEEVVSVPAFGALGARVEFNAVVLSYGLAEVDFLDFHGVGSALAVGFGLDLGSKSWGK